MKKKISAALVASAVGFLLVSTDVTAVPIYATSVDHVTEGSNFDTDKSTTEERWNTSNALGSPDGNFFSMGQGGATVFGFDSLFDTAANIIEITYGNRDNYVETADVFVWSGAAADDYSVSVGSGDWQYAGSVINSASSSTVSLARLTGNPYKYLRVVDTTGIGGDGFDIDAVSVSPVPEPTTMLLFGTGIAGLAAIGRRRK